MLKHWQQKDISIITYDYGWSILLKHIKYAHVLWPLITWGKMLQQPTAQVWQVTTLSYCLIVNGTLYSNLVSQVQSHITIPCSSCMFQWKIQSSNKGKDLPQGEYQNRKSHSSCSRKRQCLQPSTYHKMCIWTISVISHIQYYEVLALMTSIKTTNGRAKLQHQWWWQCYSL